MRAATPQWSLLLHSVEVDSCSRTLSPTCVPQAKLACRSDVLNTRLLSRAFLRLIKVKMNNPGFYETNYSRMLSVQDTH